MPLLLRVHLVRHGETVGADSAYVGDPILTPVGERQSKITADYLNSLGVSSLLVSPLQRAQQTAAPMATMINTVPRTIQAMSEISLGNYPGDQFVGRERPKIEFEAWGGDSGNDFNRRVVAGFRRVIDDVRSDTHQNVALVTHGGTINVILDHIAGIPFDGEMRYLLANCSVSTLDIGPDSVSLSGVNAVAHMPQHWITPPGEHLLPGGPSR